MKYILQGICNQPLISGYTFHVNEIISDSILSEFYCSEHPDELISDIVIAGKIYESLEDYLE